MRVEMRDQGEELEYLRTYLFPVPSGRLGQPRRPLDDDAVSLHRDAVSSRSWSGDVIVDVASSRR